MVGQLIFWLKMGLTRSVGNGALTEAELRTALVNGDWSPFDAHTVRMMIRYVVRCGRDM
jgi:hypothetical protein